LTPIPAISLRGPENLPAIRRNDRRRAGIHRGILYEKEERIAVGKELKQKKEVKKPKGGKKK